MRQRRFRQPGFTLPELLVSILMVVLLMLGVNQVFKMSSDTVGMGQTVNQQTRDLRSAIAVMSEDFERWAPDAPLFYVINQRTSDGRRRDVIGFPARGAFRRTTANDGTFVSDTTALEAWIWYGHLDADQANVLGRVQMLMKDEEVIKKTDEDYIPAGNLVLSPLNPRSQAKTQTNWNLQHHRFDLLGTTIDGLSTIVKNERPADDNEPNNNWWRPAIDDPVQPSQPFRYQAKTVIGRPISAARMAQVAPVFVTNCEEFVVEFAGDYFIQQNDVDNNEYGKYLRIGQDGKIDYHIVRQRIGSTNYDREQVRWYGFPRDTNADGQYRWQDDVAPVGTVKQNANLQTNTGDDPNYPYFERDLLPPGPNAAMRYNVVFTKGLQPKLVRASLKLVDPAGRIQNGTWSEYILGPQ